MNPVASNYLFICPTDFLWFVSLESAMPISCALWSKFVLLFSLPQYLRWLQTRGNWAGNFGVSAPLLYYSYFYLDIMIQIDTMAFSARSWPLFASSSILDSYFLLNLYLGAIFCWEVPYALIHTWGIFLLCIWYGILTFNSLADLLFLLRVWMRRLASLFGSFFFFNALPSSFKWATVL